MAFRIDLSRAAALALQGLATQDKPRAKKLRKTLALLEQDPRHPGLNSHRYADYDSLYCEKICLVH